MHVSQMCFVRTYTPFHVSFSMSQNKGKFLQFLSQNKGTFPSDYELKALNQLLQKMQQFGKIELSK
jgi:hypothetical protein